MTSGDDPTTQPPSDQPAWSSLPPSDPPPWSPPPPAEPAAWTPSPPAEQPPGYSTPPEQPGYGQPPPTTEQPAAFGAPPPYGQPPGYGEAPATPAYGQQPYGQPPAYGGYAPPPTRHTGGTESPAVGVLGVILAVLAAIAGVLAFTVLNWFDSGSDDSRFSDVRKVLSLLHEINADHTVAYYYFNWLAWVLLAVAVVAAIAANVASPMTTTFKILGALVGVAGIVFTFVAIDLISNVPAGVDTTDTPSGYWDYLKHSRVAFYVAVGAFLLTTIASLVAPRRSST